MRRVLVTGVRGLLGRAVSHQLAGDEVEVIGIHRPDDTSPASAAGEEHSCDLRDPAAARLPVGQVDGVVHLAARAGGIAFQGRDHAGVLADNVAITRSVVALARASGARRLLLASSAVVYAPLAHPAAETAPLLTPGHPDLSGYAWSKLSDEQIGRWAGDEGGPEVTIARMSNVYGPSGQGTVVHDLIGRALALEEGGQLRVWGDGRAVRDLCHVDDAADALCRLLRAADATGVYNVGGGEPVTIGELAAAVRATVAPTASVVFDTAAPQGTPYRVVDVARLRTLGWTPRVALPDGIRRTAAARAGASRGHA